jgi:hypothetical protein
MNESDLRTALRAHAESFSPTPGWLDEPPVPAKRRSRRALLAAPAVLAAAAAVIVYLGAGRSGTPAPQPPGHQQTAGNPVTIRLVGYAAPVGNHGGALPKPLVEHLDCMRANGYDLPDPQWTGHGWLLTLDDARSFGVGTMKWKRAVFVTCALTRPGRGELPPMLRHAVMHPRDRIGKPDGR